MRFIGVLSPCALLFPFLMFFSISSMLSDCGISV